MKKVTLLFILLTGMLTACGQKEVIQEATPTPAQVVAVTQESEVIPIIQTTGGAPTPTVTEKKTEDDTFRYMESSRTECFAVDEEGFLYTTTGFPEYERRILYEALRDEEESGMPEYTSQIIKIHDWAGNCIEEHILDIGIAQAMHLIVGETYLYLLIPEEDCANVLYQIDRTTWETKRLYDFTKFEFVYDMVLLGDTMYVLGKYENIKEKKFVNYQEWYDRSNGRKEVVAYLQITEETPELNIVPFDLPMYIFAVDEETLGIYGKEEKRKLRLFAYSPEENTFEGISASYSTGEEIWRRPFQYYEDGMFMLRSSHKVYYVSRDGTEYELLNEPRNYFYIHDTNWIVDYNRKVMYAEGCLFYQEYNSSNISKNFIRRVNIEDKLQEIQSE